MKEMFLVTKWNGANRWVFANEEDILPSLNLTYSNLHYKVEFIERDMFIVRIFKDDVVHADVFQVRRIPVLYKVDHL